MKKIFMMAVLLCYAISMFSQTVTIGTGTSVWSSPFEMSWGYFRYAHVYQSSEIGTTGDISSISWYVESLEADAANGPIKIYFKTVANPFIGGETWNDITTGATLVYDDNVSFIAGGWQTFNLLSPFNYSGDHLLVLVETNYGGTGSGEFYTDKNIRYTDVAAGMGEVWHLDNTPPTGTADYTTTKRPNIQLNFDQTTMIYENNHRYSSFISPNPANEMIYFSTGGFQNANLEIFSLEGKSMYSEQTAANFSESLDISFLLKGCYLARLSDAKHSVNQILIVQ